MFRPLAAALTVLLGLQGCWGASAPGASITAVPRAVAPEDPHRTRFGDLEILSLVELRSPDRWFGGVSGLSFDGTTVTAINDVGHWLRFRMDTDAAGRPVAVGALEVAPLGGLDGSKYDGDAEEVTWTPDGWIVSFERRHRLLLYPRGLSGTPERLPLPQGFSRQPDNGGVEALTRLKDGRLLMLSEEGVDPDGVGWAWVGRPGAWQRLGYRRDGLFRPTGAATLPNGDVLVTERSFTFIGGVGFRLLRIPLSAIRPGAVLEGKELLRLAPPFTLDNYEGVAVHQRPDGRTVAYIVSDDNFNALQATLLMTVLLPE